MKGETSLASASTLSIDGGQSLLPSVDPSHSPGMFWSPSISSIHPSLRNTPFHPHLSLGTLDEVRETVEGDRPTQQQSSPFLQRIPPQAAVFEESELRLDDELPRLDWCAYCGKEVVTNCSFTASGKTLWSSVAIFFLGGVLGCFLLPYCSNSCKQVVTHCSQCGRKV